MSKTAKDYPVTNPYNPPTHNGADRDMPIGIPIVISKVVIGYSGNTGKSTGPHVHTQSGPDAACQKVVNPKPYEFKPGTVTAIRTTDPYVPGKKGGEWGKYATVKTLSGKYITYAHLSQVNVKVGQVIPREEEEMVTKNGVIRIVRFRLGRPAVKKDFDLYVGKYTDDKADKLVLATPEYAAIVKRAKATRELPVNHLPQSLREIFGGK